MNVKSQTTLTYAYNLDGINYSNTTTSNVATVEVRTTNLLVKKFTNSDYYSPNDIISCTLIVTNSGNYPAINVNITDILENQSLINESIKYDFINNTTDVMITNKTQDNNPLFTIPVILPNCICVIRYKTRVKDNLSITENITSKTIVSSNEIKEFSNEEISLKQSYANIVCVKKALADFTYINNDLTYQISVTNTGNVDAINVSITDLLPETFKLNDKGVVYKDITLDYDLDNNILNFKLPNLPVNEEATIFVQGKIVA